MREYKFRGLTKETRRWAYGHYCEVDGRHVIIPNDARLSSYRWRHSAKQEIEGFIEVDPETVGQFTGRYDQNDTEIWADDKLSFTIFDHNGIDIQYTGIVCWGIEGAMWFIKCESETFELGDVLCQDDEVEVIGNIHTPEKLEDH